MTSVRVLTAVAIVAAATVLGGCSGGTAGTSQPPASTPAATTPASSASAAAPGPSSVPAASPSAGGASSGSPTGDPGSAPLRSDRCTATALSASLGDGGGGAAGSVLPDLVLTNTGTQRCTLQGFPGVSFVGGGNGTQLGAAGTFDRSRTPGTVTLDPGKSAHAPLRIARAENYPSDTCQPATADGLRVYPPGSTAALFVATTGLTACRNAGVQLITVQALLPGAS